MASLTCPHCGVAVEANNIYCPNCTRSLRLTPSESASEVIQPKRARTVGWIVGLGVAAVCALAAIPLLVVPAARVRGTSGTISGTPGQQSVCLSNMKLLALGALLYQADWDDRNLSTVAYQPLLMPYIKNTSVFYCPLSRAPYAPNPDILKYEMKKLKDPSLTILFYEGSGKKLTTPHSGMGIISFADGHVKAYAPSGISKLKWKP